jgi:hypothetical protein
VGPYKSIQVEWTFLQWVVTDVGEKCDTIRGAMHRSFLPFLIQETLSDNDPLHRLAALPVKSTGLTLTGPVESVDAHFRGSEVMNSHIIHQATTSNIKAELKKQKEVAHKSAIPRSLSYTIRHGSETGAWCTVLPSTISSTVVIRKILSHPPD